jgi:hypothetical protein
MNEHIKSQTFDRSVSYSDEAARLEMALHDPDRLLTDSLRADERRRRVRRLVSVTLLIGGMIMGTAFMAVWAGWLSLAAVYSGEAGPPDETLQKLAPGRVVDVRPVTKDCMVLAYLPEWDHGDVDNVAVANNDGGVRALFAFRPVPADLLQPQGRQVYLAVYSRKTTSGGGGGEIAVQPLVDNWPERTSWKTHPKVNAATEKTAAKFSEEAGWKFFDITPLVVEQKAKNGVILQFVDEGRSGTQGQWSGYEFVSREGEGEWKDRHPQLVIVDSAASASEQR